MDQKRTWIYCRVDYSDANSAELLNMQRRCLESYAKENGLQIVGFSSDIGNGLTLDRPGLMALHAIVGCRQADVLLVYNFDCLGRDSDMVVPYLRFLLNHGVHVHTAANGEIDFGVNEVFPCVSKK